MSLRDADNEHPYAAKNVKWIVLTALLAFLGLVVARVAPPLAPLRPVDQQLVDAVNRDDVAAVRALLSRGADPNTRSVPTDLWQPPFDTAMRRVWLRVSQPKSRRDPVLTAAASRGDAEIVTALLDKGANSDVVDADGFTPLMRAVAPWPSDRPALPTVKALLAHGARVNIKTSYDMTALMYASADGNLRGPAVPRRREAVVPEAELFPRRRCCSCVFIARLSGTREAVRPALRRRSHS